jgi:hypothetical protein
LNEESESQFFFLEVHFSQLTRTFIFFNQPILFPPVGGRRKKSRRRQEFSKCPDRRSYNGGMKSGKDPSRGSSDYLCAKSKKKKGFAIPRLNAQNGG